jgi:hypothetical protein
MIQLDGQRVIGSRLKEDEMTRKQLRAYAYREARQAGLDTNTSDACARRVVERTFDPLGIEHDSWKRRVGLNQRVLREEIQAHAAP